MRTHLGNSVSEVDPTYALQNGFDPGQPAATVLDSVAAFSPPGWGYHYPLGSPTPTVYTAENTQVDNAGIDVRLTQLRNLLAGTRPAGAGNSDANLVIATGGVPNTLLGGVPAISLPNGIADPPDAVRPVNTDAIATDGTDANGVNYYYSTRSTTPVPGRWGEAQSVPGTSFPNPALCRRCRRSPRLSTW